MTGTPLMARQAGTPGGSAWADSWVARNRARGILLPAVRARAAAAARFLSPAGTPTITATKTYTLPGAQTSANPGDTITYSIVISNTGMGDATGLMFSDMIDPNTMLVPGSLNSSPLAINDTYTATGNIAISETAGAGVLANDIDPDTANNTGLMITQVQGAAGNVGVATNTTAMGIGGVKGSVTLQANGSFTYEPPPGFTGNDTFTYQITDAGGKTDTATVTITLSSMVWFINNNAGGSNRGTFSNPFTSIASFNAVNNGVAPNPQPGDFIALRRGTGTYSEADGINLRDNQKLIGEAVQFNTVFTADANSIAAYNTFASGTMAAPTITTSAGNGVDLGSGNTVRGLNVGNTPAFFGFNGTAVGSLTIGTVDKTGTGGAINVSTSGTFGSTVNFGTLESSSSPSSNINLVGVTGTLGVTSGGTGLSGSAAASAAINISGGTVSMTYPGNVTKANAGALLSVSGGHATGTLTFSTGTLNASAGTGLQFDNADGTYNFNGTTTLNGGDAGVDILNGSGGTFSFSSGVAITSPTGTAFNVNTGTPAVTYSGTITQNNGARVVDIQGTTSNTITFGGTVTGGASNTGVHIGDTTVVNGNVTFTTLNLGTSGARMTSQAVTITGGTGTYDLGTVGIFTNNASGIVATNADGTIKTTTGTVDSNNATAINIDGPGGTTSLVMTLMMVNSSGGTADGISIQDTDGSFTVNGDGSNTSVGGNSTGGTISGKSGADASTSSGIGVYANNASNITLRRMTINGTNQNFGVRGNSVTSFILEYSTVGGTNGTSAGADEGSIIFDNLSGTSTFTNVAIAGSVEDNFRIRNSSGTSNVTITGCTFTNAPNDNLAIEPSSAANVTAHVTNNTFTGAGGDHFSTATTNSATFNVVFTGNSYSNGFPGSLGGGVTISGGNAGSSEHVNFNISNNGTAGSPLTGDVGGGALNINQGQGAGIWQGQVNGNFIGNAGVANSGSTQSSLIRVENHSTSGTMTATIDGNTLRQWNNGSAINTQAGDAGNATNTGVLNVKITNNNIANPGPASQHGIVLNIGAGDGDNTAANTACADIKTNTLNLGASPPNGGFSFRLRQRESSTVRLPGYAGATTDTTAVGNFVTGQNSGTPNTASVSVSSPPGGGYTGGAACTAPVVPAGLQPEEMAASSLPHNATADDRSNEDSALRAARGEGPYDQNLRKLTQEELTWMLQAALTRWAATGISVEDLLRLQAVTFEVADLPNSELASINSNRVRIDDLAAGYGWFYDQTPSEDDDFQVPVPGRELQAAHLSPARGKMDLLTVVMRELSTVYLQGKKRVPKKLRPLMQPTLSPGVRRMPVFNIPERTTSSVGSSDGQSLNGQVFAPALSQPETDYSLVQNYLQPAVFNPSTEWLTGSYSSSAKRMSYTASAKPSNAASARRVAYNAAPSGTTVTVPASGSFTLPPGKSFTVMFQVTVNDPFTGATAQVSNQGTVSGSNFSPVLTDDPNVAGAANPTVTPVNLPDVTVAVSPASTPEDGAGNLVYTFTRAGSTTGAITVNFTVGGTATFSTDYTQTGAATFTASSGTVTIPAGSATATVTIDPTADTTVEPDETVILTVVAGIGYEPGVPAAATGTITNDDTDVSVAVAPSSVAEDGAANLVYTFTRAGVTTGALTVNFTVGGTATFNTDYTQTGAATFTATTGTVTFTAGNATATVTIDPTADTTVEPDETVILTVTSGTGYNVGVPAAATGTITNDDTDVSVAVAPSSVAEDGAANLVYTFTRAGVTTGALTVNFTVGGTATFNTDYTQTGAATFTATTGTVTFTAGNATATVTIDPTADTTVEPDETVILTVTSGTGYNVGVPAAATGTITNDDTDVSVAVAPSSVAEDGAANLVYTFTRNGTTTGALTVNFTVGGTATFNTDYTQSGAATFTASSGTVTFTAGNTTATVTIDPTADTAFEPDETVILTVTSGTGYSVGSPAAATGTITNDDTEVSVAVSPTSVAEDGAANLVYTFTRAGNTTNALTVNFTVGGTATFNTDYTQTGAATFTPPTGTVTFSAGSSTATVTVDPTADTTVEPDETVILTVAAGTGYTVGAPASATGTITNDDADVTLTVSPAAVAEDGAANLVYTFTRSGFTTGALTVNFTVGGTATFNTDYTQSGAATFTASNGSVTFGAGNATATVTVDPTADATGEPDETVILTLASGAGYSVGSPSSATGTILNDDTAVSVVVSPLSVAEDGAANLVYTFMRTGDTSTPLTVNFSVGGTATFSTDYTQSGAATFTASSGTVTIATGNASATVTVDPTADLTVEPDETVILTVVAGSGYSPGPPTTATGTITNDDTDVSVAVSPSSVAEDGATNLVYTFTRTGLTTGALTINFSVGGTATFNTDYTQTGADTFSASSGTVTFGAGNATATVTVDPTADTTVEPDETVILTVTSGTGYNVGAPAAATGTITNDDTDVTLTVSPSSVSEDGAANLVYTFTRSGLTTSSLTVNFAVSGTATFNTDYTQTGAATFTAINGSVTFGAGNATATVTIDPTADSTPEPDETVTLALTSGAGYNLGNPNSATGTIANDDTDVTVAVSPSSVTEDGPTNLIYTFTRTGITNTSLTVNILVSGTATFGTDYTQSGATTFGASSGTVTFGAGIATVMVTIDPTADITVEPDETVILMVAPGASYNVGVPNTATGTITNDDTDVSVAVSPASVPENGAANLVYTFTRSGVTTGALTVNFSVGGTATFNTDYTQSGAATFGASSGTVTFGAGSSTATVTVDPTADATVEPDETVILTVTSGTGYNIVAPASATGTITNDDTDVTLTVSPATVGEIGSTNLVYTFTRNGVTNTSLTVNFSVGGTATFSTDYTQTGAATFGASSGTVTFTTGNTTATVSLTPINDVLVEGSETVILTLTAGSGYSVGAPSTATGTITDNDTATISFAASSSNAPEQTSPHNVGVVLNITANGSGTAMLGRNVMVNVQDLGTGTATGGGVDYSFSSPQTVTFASGAVNGAVNNVPITIVNDTLSEGNETINLALNTLVDNTGGQVSLTSPTSHTVTIVDNDIDLKVTKTESADPVTAGSGAGNLTYTIKVKNMGLTNATGVALSETLTIPSGVTVDSVTGSAGTSVTPIDATHYTWNVGNLNVKAEATLTVVLTVGVATQTGTNVICDTATVTASTEVRVNTSDDTVTECTSVVQQADLQIISKSAVPPDLVCVNGDITYTISFINNGVGQGINTKVTDAIPGNTNFQSASVMTGSGWNISAPAVGATSGNVVFSKGTVLSGETATFKVVMRVNAGTAHHTMITNMATASSDIVDPNPNNNTGMAKTTVDPTAPMISCPKSIETSAETGKCSATVSFGPPTASDNCALASVMCSPASGSTFPVGTTTVNCTATDTAGNTATCSFTVKVNDTQPPQITCPGPITAKTANAGDACVGVTYTTPTATDNCMPPNPVVVCTPPSGSCFPAGVNTVTCTATDASGNTATCTFAVFIFNGWLQDDSEGCTNSLLFSTVTGDYRWCCHGTTFTGRGTVTRSGNTYTLQHNATDRRMLATLSAGVSPPSGKGSIQFPAGTTRCTISDRDIRNDPCLCGAP